MKHLLYNLVCRYGEDWEGWFILSIFNRYEIHAGWYEDDYGNPQDKALFIFDLTFNKEYVIM
jgi:hypothetical protein